MTRCPACGRRYDDAARFCAFDGTALVAVGAPVVGGRAGEARSVPPAAGASPSSRALGDLLARADTPAPSRPGLPPVAGPVPEPSHYAPPAASTPAAQVAAEPDAYGPEPD
ncbi:MAG TPA: hypothetical protein VGB53_06380, partial [Rubricoccaceae bacterium]